MLQHIVAIVSGGASGLGAATASYLVQNGARVIVADCGASAREHFLQMKASTGGDGVNEKSRLIFSQADITNESDVSSALNKVELEFGEHVNVAINCAGVGFAKKTLSQRLSDDGSVTHRLHSNEDFAKIMNVNVNGTFNLSRLAADRMAYRALDKDGLRGCIINTASVAAYEGQVGQVAYASSKGAIVGMTLPMARDLAPLGIRVMTIAPGLFMTPLLAQLPENVSKDLAKSVLCPSRLGDPLEFAKLVACIIQNPYLNGEVIRLDGAIRMPP